MQHKARRRRRLVPAVSCLVDAYMLRAERELQAAKSHTTTEGQLEQEAGKAGAAGEERASGNGG